MLAKHAGRRVLVLERHYTAGGFTHVFRRPGYEWDVGVHYIGGAHLRGSASERILNHLTEGRLEWAAMPEVYDRIRIGDKTYDLVAGLRNFQERLKEYFPEECRAIQRYVAAVQRCVLGSRLYFAERAVPALVARLAGWAMRAGFLWYAGRTTGEMLARLTQLLGEAGTWRPRHSYWGRGDCYAERGRLGDDARPGRLQPAGF